MEVKEQGSESENANYFLNIRMLTINTESFSLCLFQIFTLTPSIVK